LNDAVPPLLQCEQGGEGVEPRAARNNTASTPQGGKQMSAWSWGTNSAPQENPVVEFSQTTDVVCKIFQCSGALPPLCQYSTKIVVASIFLTARHGISLAVGLGVLISLWVGPEAQRAGLLARRLAVPSTYYVHSCPNTHCQALTCRRHTLRPNTRPNPTNIVHGQTPFTNPTSCAFQAPCTFVHTPQMQYDNYDCTPTPIATHPSLPGAVP
jgi:hypothetical protein